MADTLSSQLRLQASIARAIENLKKIGKCNYTAAKLRSRIETLNKSWTQYQDGHDLLMTDIPVDQRLTMDYFNKGFFDITEDMYNSAMDYMADCLAELESPAAATASTSKDKTLTAATSSSVHLPPIKLPPFDGKYEEWETFRDRFTALIIKNHELSAFARMHFLTSCLSGRALECIRNLPVTAENFSVAWSTLVSRFENPRRLLSLHLSTLLTLPTVTREAGADLQAFRDKIAVTVASLSHLKRSPAELWNDILVHIVSQKLDPTTGKSWTLKINEIDDIPTYSELDAFVSSRIRALEELTPASAVVPSRAIQAPKIHIATASTDSSPACPLCSARHFINICPTFIHKTPAERREIVRSCKRCFNSLSLRHSAQECQSKYACRVCQKRHHTMLHLNTESCATTSPAVHGGGNVLRPGNSKTEVHTLLTQSDPQRQCSVLLATAWVNVCSSTGQSILARALIDQGSERTFVSEHLVQTLRASRIRMPTSVSAVGGVSVGTIRFAAQISITPRDSSHPSLETTALILPSLTSYVPRRIQSLDSFPHLSSLVWADPDPSSSDPIQIIIGADLYANIILDGIRRGQMNQPFAQNSIFGWVISGPVSPSCSTTSIEDLGRDISKLTVHHCSVSDSLEEAIRQFWETEEIPRHSVSNPLEAQCEQHFVASHSREEDGRYIVRLPFRKESPIDKGHSKQIAKKSLESLSRRLQRQPELIAEYNEFFTEYERLGHMRPVPDTHRSRFPLVFIPYHPVIREDSTTSHMRIVFNASSPTTNGSSLNDHLLPGPKLQSDIIAVILSWRKWKFVCTADIAKMYRQIKLDNRDIDYQRILWQPPSTSHVTEYHLLTVTYGMSCAPFLALRVLQQLVEDEGKAYPLAVPILRDNIYVDDVLFGADDVAHLLEIRAQLTALLNHGGFVLRKWSGNSPAILADIGESDHGLACDKSLSDDERVKILGLGWCPSRDVFRVQVTLDDNFPGCKRAVLSAIAKLYDPSGWVTPVIIAAKIFMQQLWRHALTWDEPLPAALFNRWKLIYCQFAHLNGLEIPRWLGIHHDSSSVELHGFADASNVAYAAVVYIRAASNTGEVTTSLLIGKSKVAPLSPLSVPRLELSAAVLLARLIEYVRAALGVSPMSVVCWSDSTVVLSWLNQHPFRWKTFVANRVADVFRRIPEASWRHVPTACNPADCASRGILGGGELPDHSLWWNGPPWLRLSSTEWPVDVIHSSDEALNEAKQTVLLSSVSRPTWDLASRFSSWPKLIRVTAFVMRFVQLCRRPSATNAPTSYGGSLTVEECQASRTFWLKTIQTELFPRELHALTQRSSISTKSSILALRPFLDHCGIMRVGGRLGNAPIPFHARHPILLSSHPLTSLIIRQAHQRALHSGTQLTLNILRRDYWIIRGRTLVKSVIHNCVACTRERAAVPIQLMGDLPDIRVSPNIRCFQHCGIDYAGPVSVLTSAGRGSKSRKAYIALFICMATRAIHLELVGDYSTSAFLNAFSRFCSRRGLPQSMYSHNGTTFVGADRELTTAYRAALRDPDFLNATVSDSISWNFIPPSAPHFGGLWEAGVRSVKHHLRRVLGSRTLTFEEFSTLLCRIEACLNSRPLAPLTDTLDDYECLTPGHFLVGSALAVNPEPSLLDLNENRLSRWQLVRHITERFWKLWQVNYVNTLQQRGKWKNTKANLTVGQLVLLRNSTLPPCKWELGRVIQCHAGSDDLVRVVTVKTKASEFKRPIGKLCVLPVQSAA